MLLLLSIIIAAGGVGGAILFRNLCRKLRRSRRQLLLERRRRIAWERSAGLPFWDTRETEAALWVRASRDPDDPAGEVLRSLYFEEDLPEGFLEDLPDEGRLFGDSSSPRPS